MGIRANFNVNDVARQATAQAVTEVYNKVIRHLSRVGEEAVSLARDYHANNYLDQSGNLRASLGYVITYNGKTVDEAGFDPGAAQTTKKARDGETGARKGRKLAYQIARRHSSGFALVVVAGMYYGEYVEKRQYDVLTFTEANARILADQLLQSMFGNAA